MVMVGPGVVSGHKETAYLLKKRLLWLVLRFLHILNLELA